MMTPMWYMDKLYKLEVKTLFQIDASKWEIFDLIFNISNFFIFITLAKNSHFFDDSYLQ